MLVISRKLGESIVIELPGGRLVEVVVCRVGCDQVRLGTEAPPDVPIARGELVEPATPLAV
jgi:carbon storage regulator CsrA